MNLALQIGNVSYLHDKLGMIADNVKELRDMAHMHQAKIISYLGWATKDAEKEGWFLEACKEASEFVSKNWR